MKCPKCKTEMVEDFDVYGFDSGKHYFLICEQEDCEYYGIKRINRELNKKGLWFKK